MKRVILILGLVLLFAGSAAAAPMGLGGYIYYGVDAGGAFDEYMKLYRFEVDGHFDYVTDTKVQFDNVAIDQVHDANGYDFTQELEFNCEVYDPRHEGGTGKLIVAGIVDNGTPVHAGADHATPWDVVLVDPDNPTTDYSKANGNMLTNGRTWGAGDWQFYYAQMAMAAPPDWAGTSNGISVLTVAESSGSYDVSAIYDADDNGIVDDSAAEGTLISTDVSICDSEFGKDGCLYQTYSQSTSINSLIKIRKTWIDTGTPMKTTFFNAADNAIRFGDRTTMTQGLAVGPQETKPIVYLYQMDNVADTYTWTLWAMRDDDDNGSIDISPGSPDTFVQVWRDGELGISLSRKLKYDGGDIEYYDHPNPDNQDVIIVAGYSGNDMFALELADNGLKAIAAHKISGLGTGIDAWPGGWHGFEIDMAGPVIPEPGTMLLLGTGVLGVLGYVRRRRMK